MPRTPAVLHKAPTLAPDRALKALNQQLDALRKLKGRKCHEAESEKSQWQHLTRSIIEAAFGDPSSELIRFQSARVLGTFNLPGTSQQQQQEIFDKQVQELENLLQALTTTLRLHLPEEEIKGMYEPGHEYAFYRDLSSLVQAATQDILLVDAYLDENLFNLYVSKAPATVTVRILSNHIGPNVVAVAKMYLKSRPLHLRSSPEIHDRAIFLDARGWVSGQSIKDAAKKKPTYLIELDEPLLMASREIHNRIWAAATDVI